MRRALRVFLAAAGLAAVAVAANAPRASLHVEGLGWWSDHAMRGTLTLLLGDQRGKTLDAGAIEDGALVLYSSLSQQGYLQPDIRVRVTEAAGGVETFAMDPTLEHPLPRTIAATGVAYLIRKGRRSKVGDVTFVGLTALKPDLARTYFRGEGVFAALTEERAYSPDRLERSLGMLLDELRRLGYAEAQAEAAAPEIDPKTHVARIVVTVRQGPLWSVDAIDVSLSGPGPAPPDLERKKVGHPWSEAWRHDVEADLRRWYFQHGYADARVTVTPETGPPVEGVRDVTARARIEPGPEVRLGAIRFSGNTRTHESVLRPLVKAEPGQPLNPLEAQEAEYRISRLGVFSRVDLRYEPVQGPVRDEVFDLQEGKRQDVDLLAGWGSYEELRGGVEWRNFDIWGLGHEGTLRVTQSFKSSEGEYDYSMPELFGSSVDLTDKTFGFRRLERAFVDEQYGNTLSGTTALKGIGSQLSAGYTFERVQASSNSLATVLSEAANANATSVEATITRDRRDNPLRPREGYKISFEAEEASRYLGGQVDFQQFQFEASYHTSWGHSRWIHIGFTHEVITTMGAPAGQELPPNVFFYPGGEDSIRGFSLGQAAPRDPVTAAYLPAKAVTLVNLELEQALTSKISAVVFSDTLGATESLAHYPFDYELYTLGLGLRYQTIIGPIRLEYGRNVNPRPHDPQGTVQFSIGFPF